MINDDLIGYTGFAGGTLDRQHSFCAKFNSANIDAIAGQVFNSVVCAAAPLSMVTAKCQPERDRAAAAGTKIAVAANPAAYGTNVLTTLKEAEAFVVQVGSTAAGALV